VTVGEMLHLYESRALSVVLIGKGYISFMMTHLQSGWRWETAYTFVQHVNITHTRTHTHIYIYIYIYINPLTL